MIQETFKSWDLVRLILEVLRCISICMHKQTGEKKKVRTFVHCGDMVSLTLVNISCCKDLFPIVESSQYWFDINMAKMLILCIDNHYEDFFRMMTIISNPRCIVSAVNSFWPVDAIWWHRTGTTLVQVMAWCQMPPSHTWTYVDFSSVRSSDSHLASISQEIPQPWSTLKQKSAFCMQVWVTGMQ